MQGLFFPLLTLLGGLSALMVLYVGGRLVMAGTVTVGAFVAFGVYLAMLVWPMIALGWAVNLVQRGAASMGRINQLFRERAAIAEPATRRSRCRRPAAGRAVEFRNVWFAYPGARGARLGAAGHLASGSRRGGRSPSSAPPARASPRWWTCWSAPTTRTAGAVLLDGVDIRRLPLAELRRAVGFVPQETFLFSETLRDNVLLGAPDDGRLERVAEVAQLTEALPALPNGFDTMLGERGINLSGGQKQRSAIARALAQDPPVFVLDDALSAVDAQTEAKILRALRGALAGAPASSCPTVSRRCATRTGSWCWTRAGSWRRGTHARADRARRALLGAAAPAAAGGGARGNRRGRSGADGLSGRTSRAARPRGTRSGDALRRSLSPRRVPPVPRSAPAGRRA